MRLKLTIAYDGANYAGWQIQKVGLGVQQVIEEARQLLDMTEAEQTGKVEAARQAYEVIEAEQARLIEAARGDVVRCATPQDGAKELASHDLGLALVERCRKRLADTRTPRGGRGGAENYRRLVVG